MPACHPTSSPHLWTLNSDAMLTSSALLEECLLDPCIVSTASHLKAQAAQANVCVCHVCQIYKMYLSWFENCQVVSGISCSGADKALPKKHDPRCFAFTVEHIHKLIQRAPPAQCFCSMTQPDLWHHYSPTVQQEYIQ